MDKRGGGIKVISKNTCPVETIEGFNKRIAEVIAMKYSKEIIEEIIREYDRDNQRCS
jgi:hypothetical protein